MKSVKVVNRVLLHIDCITSLAFIHKSQKTVHVETDNGWHEFILELKCLGDS